MTINNEKIAEIAQRSPTAESFFTYAACRERNVREGVSRLSSIKAQMEKEGFDTVPQDLLSVFKGLHEAGVGELRGDKFKWNVPITKVGAAAVKTTAVTVPEKIVAKDVKETTNSFIVFFDKKKYVTVSYSDKLSKDEASFLAEKLLQDISK